MPGDGTAPVVSVHGDQHRRPDQPRGRAGLPASRPAADQPVRLVGWAAVTAEPGETVTVRVDTDARLWRRWDTAAGAWTTLDRRRPSCSIARGLGDIRATLPLT